MSATLRVSDFAANTTLFPSPPPVISIPARQHPVTVHFARRTQSDYVSEAIKKVVKIHARLPPGGVLVFLTGQSEIVGVARKLEARYGRRAVEERRVRKVVRFWVVRVLEHVLGRDRTLSVESDMGGWEEREDVQKGICEKK